VCKIGLDHSESSNDEVKLLWDFNIWNDKVISARRPDIVVINKPHNAVQLIDVSVPADHHVVSKEIERLRSTKTLESNLKDSDLCYTNCDRCTWCHLQEVHVIY